MKHSAGAKNLSKNLLLLRNSSAFTEGNIRTYIIFCQQIYVLKLHCTFTIKQFSSGIGLWKSLIKISIIHHLKGTKNLWRGMHLIHDKLHTFFLNYYKIFSNFLFFPILSVSLVVNVSSLSINIEQWLGKNKTAPKDE